MHERGILKSRAEKSNMRKRCLAVECALAHKDHYTDLPRIYNRIVWRPVLILRREHETHE